MEILTEEEAREVLNRVNLPVSSNKVTLLAVSPKAVRQRILYDPNHEEKPTAAAIEIQRIWRGYWTRCQVLDKFYPTITNEAQPDNSSYKNSVLAPGKGTPDSQAYSRRSPYRSTTSSSSNETQDSSKSLQLKKAYRKWLEENEPISFDDYCNLVSKSLWQEQESSDMPTDRPPTMVGSNGSGRTSTVYSPFIGVRCETPERSGSRLSTKSVQFKTVPTKRSDTTPSEVLTRIDAAIIIQKNWRSYIDKQVFQYYRDLINFKSRGDPSLLLRCINPKEAELLDSASGTHVKFRLAGSNFPPNIYYKIFTHRPVVDLCANSPKDYTKAAVKQLIARQCHNNSHSISHEGGKDGWYQRWENNGWRLVSERIIKKLDEDAVVYDSAQKKMTFNHSRILRKQDVEKKRRQKKIEWMKKMYRDGMLCSKQGTQSPVEDDIGRTIHEIIATTDKLGDGVVEDWEVDEILEWTNGLNFDNYLSGWKEYGTSATSDQLAEKSQFFSQDRQVTLSR